MLNSSLLFKMLTVHFALLWLRVKINKPNMKFHIFNPKFGSKQYKIFFLTKFSWNFVSYYFRESSEFQNNQKFTVRVVNLMVCC